MCQRYEARADAGEPAVTQASFHCHLHVVDALLSAGAEPSAQLTGAERKRVAARTRKPAKWDAASLSKLPPLPCGANKQALDALHGLLSGQRAHGTELPEAPTAQSGQRPGHRMGMPMGMREQRQPLPGALAFGEQLSRGCAPGHANPL